MQSMKPFSIQIATRISDWRFKRSTVQKKISEPQLLFEEIKKKKNLQRVFAPNSFYCHSKQQEIFTKKIKVSRTEHKWILKFMRFERNEMRKR